MTIQVGQQAPDFTLFDESQQPFTLSDAARDASVVLLFFPGAFTGVCTKQMCAVNDDLSAYDGLGARVVGISTDSPFVLAEFKKRHGLTFPLLSDHDADVSEAYGAKYHRDFTGMKLDRIARRAAFVVGPGGVVRYAEVLESAGDLPDADAVKRALQAE
jgi:glutaredoxin-dependent peroxiredoxin